MTLLLSLLGVSVVVNILLTARLLLIKSDYAQSQKLLHGTLHEKGRLRKIIHQIKIYQN